MTRYQFLLLRILLLIAASCVAQLTGMTAINAQETLNKLLTELAGLEIKE
jgi:hypothetical protein